MYYIIINLYIYKEILNTNLFYTLYIYSLV